MNAKIPAIRRCTECKEYFQPVRYGLKILKQCGKECIIIAARKIINKYFDAETRKMKIAANDKDPTYWSDKAQKQCNKYILIRDAKKPCISCGNKNNVKYDAGHYISRGHSAALRFNEFNIHKQCSAYCNSANSGQSIRYRQGLVKLYGEDKVLWLEGHHEMPRYRIDDYKRIYTEYKLKIKELMLK